MYRPQVYWDLADDPAGNVRHVAEHGLSVDDVEAVLFDPASTATVSRTSGDRVTFGHTPDGRYVAVVWQAVGDDAIRPITAFEAPEPRSQR